MVAPDRRLKRQESSAREAQVGRRRGAKPWLAWIRARVYSFDALPARKATAVVSSTASPWRMTSSRSHRCATTARSWLTSTYVRPSLHAQVVEQVQDLGLHRSIERRGRLVEQQDLRAAGSARGRSRCAGAGRRRAGADSGSGTTARARPRARPARMRASASRSPWIASGSDEGAVDGVARMERGVGVLEHHLDGAVEGLVARRRHRLSVDHDAAVRDRRKAADRAQHRRLAGAGFADEAEGRAGLHVKAHVLDGIDPHAAGPKTT